MARKYDPQQKWHDRQARRGQARDVNPKTQNLETPPVSKYDQWSIDMSAFQRASYMFGIDRAVDAATPPPPQPKPPAVRWDDVVGQVEAKAAMREAIEGATKHAALYKKYGRRPTKGLLLYGPPGNGKTMLGKAAAGALAEQHGGKGQDTAFIYVKGPDVFAMYLGETEKKIRELFARAKRHKDSYGYPAVLFVDEAESFLSHREEGTRSGISVPPFLAEMDGMTDSGALVLLATNRPSSLDTAIIREGRIDRKILVGRPTREDATALFARLLKSRPAGDGVAEAATAALFDPGHVLYRVTLSDGRTKVVTLGSFTSGAQIAYLVDAAASFAIERELATGIEGSIIAEDFVSAIERTLREQRDLDHPSELATFCEAFVHSVTGLERVRSDGVLIGRPSLRAPMPHGMKIVMPSGEELPQN